AEGVGARCVAGGIWLELGQIKAESLPSGAAPGSIEGAEDHGVAGVNRQRRVQVPAEAGVEGLAGRLAGVGGHAGDVSGSVGEAHLAPAPLYYRSFQDARMAERTTEPLCMPLWRLASAGELGACRIWISFCLG